MKTLRSKSSFFQKLGGLFALGTSFGLLAAACSSMESDSRPKSGDHCFYGCDDGAPGGWDAGTKDKDTVIADGGGDPLPLSPLCGQGSCHPDDSEACTGDFFGLEAELSADDEVPPDPDPEPDAGTDGDAEPSLPPEPGDEPPPDEGDAGADSGDEPELPNVACHVRRGAKGPERACEATGSGVTGSPCMSASDCAPGWGCVGPKHGGVCRPYCCGDVEACPSRTYCEVRELRDDADDASPMGIPVCVPAMDCKLLEQEPCASLGLVCGIVRADGTTSCVLPGTGKLDEPCPCAFGYVCAKSQNKCLKLCHVNLASAQCPGGTCQGGTGELPPGIGVCVGGYEDAG